MWSSFHFEKRRVSELGLYGMTVPSGDEEIWLLSSLGLLSRFSLLVLSSEPKKLNLKDMAAFDKLWRLIKINSSKECNNIMIPNTHYLV